VHLGVSLVYEKGATGMELERPKKEVVTLPGGSGTFYRHLRITRYCSRLSSSWAVVTPGSTRSPRGDRGETAREMYGGQTLR
jgi:hypothetical protein